MNCPCRSIRAHPSHLRARISRTFPRSQAYAIASLSLPGLSLHSAEISAPRPAIPATIRTPGQIAFQVPFATAAPAPDFALRWKLQSAKLRAAPLPDNKSGSTPDHPPRCKEFLPPPIAEKPRDSPAPKKCPPPPETPRTNPPRRKLWPAIRFAPRAPTPQPPP